VRNQCGLDTPLSRLALGGHGTQLRPLSDAKLPPSLAVLINTFADGAEYLILYRIVDRLVTMADTEEDDFVQAQFIKGPWASMTPIKMDNNHISILRT
jgi:hypothetical protein